LLRGRKIWGGGARPLEGGGDLWLIAQREGGGGEMTEGKHGLDHDQGGGVKKGGGPRRTRGVGHRNVMRRGGRH